jgi:hypothetical protein
MSEGRFLEGFLELKEFARDEVEKHVRTVQGWCAEPNGLPYVKLGGTVLIHVPTARTWLLNRLRRNSRRGTNRIEHRRQGDAA